MVYYYEKYLTSDIETNPIEDAKIWKQEDEEK